MKSFLPLLFIFFFPFPMLAQSLAGNWTGYLIQNGKTDTFAYQLLLEEHADNFIGSSHSVSPDGKTSADFDISALWNGEELVLQEIHQTQPVKPRWCLKYATLNFSLEKNIMLLQGEWKADGCRPGQIFLKKTLPLDESFVLPPHIGKWTGYLTQSDRDYGFYFEMDISEDGSGKSFIVSEDNGGSAFHQLDWSFDPVFNSFEHKESHVSQKTDPNWKWCIKSSALQFDQEKLFYTLDGDWNGYLEGYDPVNGKCASGTIHLEKIIETDPGILLEERPTAPYEEDQKREVNITKVLEVKSETIRIKVWDNGIVDGDIVTIFLNGKMLMENYRVSKRKWSLPVKINEGDNYLILHAEDLGEIQPNTVAVSIDDGYKEHRIIICSNLNESGAILIKRFRLD